MPPKPHYGAVADDVVPSQAWFSKGDEAKARDACLAHGFARLQGLRFLVCKGVPRLRLPLPVAACGGECRCTFTLFQPWLWKDRISGAE